MMLIPPMNGWPFVAIFKHVLFIFNQLCFYIQFMFLLHFSLPWLVCFSFKSILTHYIRTISLNRCISNSIFNCYIQYSLVNQVLYSINQQFNFQFRIYIQSLHLYLIQKFFHLDSSSKQW